MKKIAIIDSNKCDQSPFCPVKRVCPAKAVTQKRGFLKGGVPVIDQEKCTGCGLCVQYCPMNAVKVKKVKSA
jgi:NAD-dependent dihydropyrimidine dehydrogenase PreA subunit